jgi:hypothetical protein
MYTELTCMRISYGRDHLYLLKGSCNGCVSDPYTWDHQVILYRDWDTLIVLYVVLMKVMKRQILDITWTIWMYLSD